jgi:hypothetical protein
MNNLFFRDAYPVTALRSVTGSLIFATLRHRRHPYPLVVFPVWYCAKTIFAPTGVIKISSGKDGD